MRVSYHHANPRGGNESFLLRFRSDSPSTRTTVLVDAGARLELDRILESNEALDAICLTHAHSDHYQSIEQSRQADTTVYASPATASIIDDVLDAASREHDLIVGAATAAAVEPVDGWTSIGPNVDFHPIPAGHAPGAVGYLFQFDANDSALDTGHILATGDFTPERAGGYPGFPIEEIHDVDILFLTAATSENFGQQLSEGLGTALQQSHSGLTTLVTASGLVGVQAAYLLDTLITHFELGLRVRLVGQVAKLYEKLNYECRRVDTLPRFDHTDECLEHGTITIAGPEVPTERSSGRLFGVLREQPNACVVQLISSGTDPIQSGRCTMYHFNIAHHPPRNTLDRVHDAVDPYNTVIVHRHRGAGSEFNDLDSYVWSPTDAAEYVLYSSGEWQTPPWMDSGPRAAQSTDNRRIGSMIGDDILDNLSLPDLTRHETPDLPSEGIDVTQIDSILAQDDAYTDSTAVPTTAITSERDSTPDNAATPAEPPTMTSNGAETNDSTAPDEGETQGPPIESVGLISTTGASIDDLDDQIIAAIEAGDISIEDIKAVAARTNQNNESTGTTQKPTETDHDEDHTSSDQGDVDGESAAEVPADTESDDSSDSEEGQAESEPADALSSEAEETTDGSEDHESRPDDPGSGHDTVLTVSPEEENRRFTVQLDHLSTALVAHMVETDVTTDKIATVTQTAMTEFLAGHLRETISIDEVPTVEHASSPVLEDPLLRILTTTDEFSDLDELTAVALGQTLEDIVGLDTATRAPDIELPIDPALVDALIERDASAFESRDDVVSAAIRWYVGSDV